MFNVYLGGTRGFRLMSQHSFYAATAQHCIAVALSTPQTRISSSAFSEVATMEHSLGRDHQTVLDLSSNASLMV